MDVEEFIEIVNEGHLGWIPSDYSFRYYDIGKNYPILNLSIENNKILLPIEFVIYPFCDNASEIPMIISNRNSILLFSIKNIKPAIERNKWSQSAQIIEGPLIDLYYFWQDLFDGYPNTRGNILKDKNFALWLNFQIDITKISGSPFPKYSFTLPNSAVLPNIQNVWITVEDGIHERVLRRGERSSNLFLERLGFKNIMAFNNCYIGANRTETSYAMYVSFNLVDLLTFFLPITEIYIGLRDYIVGITFSEIRLSEDHVGLMKKVLAAEILSKVRLELNMALDMFRFARGKTFLKYRAFNWNYEELSPAETEKVVEEIRRRAGE